MHYVYRVFNTEDKSLAHEYNITVQEDTSKGYTEYNLYRSNDGEWSNHVKGKKCLTLINTGNGVIFPKKKYKEEIDYSQTAELFILLTFINYEKGIFKGTIEKSIFVENYEI